MKKIFSLLLATVMLFGAGMLRAQTQPAQKTTQTNTTTTHTKKDGTPDKRYKENKTTTPAATPAKGNTAAAPANNAHAATPATTHTKKDGSPDQRYKENKPAKPATTPSTTTTKKS